MTGKPNANETGITQSDMDELAAKVQTLAAKARDASHPPGDLGLAALWMKDAADLQEVLEAIRKMDLDRAGRLVRELETAARDEVPARLYECIVNRG